MVHGRARHLYASLTRFVPESVRGLFEQVGPCAPELSDGDRASPEIAAPRPSAAVATPTLDVAARLRGAWR